MTSRKSWLWDSSKNIPRSTKHNWKKKAQMIKFPFHQETAIVSTSHVRHAATSSPPLIPHANYSNDAIESYNDDQPIHIEELLAENGDNLDIEFVGNLDVEFHDGEDAEYIDGDDAEFIDGEDMNNFDISDNVQDSGDHSEDNGNYGDGILDFTTLIQCYIHRYKISDRAADALLKLMKLSFTLTEEEKVKIPSSIHLLRQKLKIQEKFEPQLGWICDKCQKVYYNSFSERKTPSDYTICLDCLTTAGSTDDYFVTLSLEKTLTYLLQNNKKVRDAIKYGNCNHDIDTIQDICCGTIRKELDKELRGNHVTLMFNTDGVPIFHSSKCSTWPILVTISELPQILRKNNVLCLGLFFGKEKPNFRLFLENFVQELQKLSTMGLNWISEGIEKNLKVFCIGCLADSVARPILQNVIQYNGQYGCQCCLNPGVVVSKRNGHMRAYEPNTEYELRTLHLHQEHVRYASENNVSYGVKGVSILQSIPGFNVIEFVPIDYMHCVLLGVTRTFTKLWLDSGYSSSPFYLGKSKTIIDYRLKNINPNNLMARTPRSVDEIPFWKAHEWRNWLLFYSPIILKDVLPKTYLDHWCILSYTIHVLSRKIIKKSELSTCKTLLQTFVSDVKQLYGLEHCSYNVHLLLHLCNTIERYGPLFGFSLFTFENFNQILLAAKVGTQAVPSQMVKHYTTEVALSSINHNACNPFASIFSSFMAVKKPIIQMPKPFKLDEIGLTEEDLIPLTLGKKILEIVSYERFSMDHFTIHSSSYKRDKKRDSSCVFLTSGSVFCIEKFIEIRTCQNVHVCAVGNIYETVNPEITENLNFLGHIEKQCGPGTYTVVPVSNIKEPAIVITCNRDCLYAKFPNFVEYRD